MTAEFPETHWSLLLELKDPAHPRYAEHLDRLARQYWKPVYHYARALRPGAAAEADDLTQQFFAMMLDRRDLEKLSPERGSFRGFLKTALRHFLASRDRAAGARMPQDGRKLFRYEEAEAEWQSAARDVSPEAAFDREWTRGVLMAAVARLRKELISEGKQLHYDLFREYCLEDREISYEDVARERGVKPDDVRNYLRVVRRRLREILRGLLKDYLASGQDVEEELRFILS